jgi:hypothetical protein
MAKLAADRQLILDDSVLSYLASRIERSFAAARAAVVTPAGRRRMTYRIFRTIE